MIKKLTAIGVTAAFLSAAPAAATTVIDGKCANIAGPSGCMFETNINTSTNGNNSYLLAEAAFNTYNNTHPGAGSDIKLTPITLEAPTIVAAADNKSGTWSFANYLVDFFAVKAGDNFIIYKIDPASSGTWNTNGLVNKKGQAQALSHLVFFGAQVAVPEPATWAMMIGGFALVGAASRRRMRSSVTYA